MKYRKPDQSMKEWMEREYGRLCRVEKRHSTHLDDDHARREYNRAVRTKELINLVAGAEAQRDAFLDAVQSVGNMLGASMMANDLAPGVYEAVMKTLNDALDNALNDVLGGTDNDNRNVD